MTKRTGRLYNKNARIPLKVCTLVKDLDSLKICKDAKP
jgi:hypothetical protein